MGQTVVAIAMLRQYIFSPPFLNVEHILIFFKILGVCTGKEGGRRARQIHQLSEG